MNKYLIDVPVKINIWIRKDCQRRQWEVIRKARPSILFLQSDGGRNEIEWESILFNRKMIDESIDWECIVYRLYENKNNGLYAMSKKTISFVWSKVDRCIFLEDDQIPSVSFFWFCAELLEKYKDDTRIHSICGMNHLGVFNDVSSDYFFSRNGSIWGCASWKRCFHLRTFDYYSDSYVMNLLKQKTKKNKECWKKLNAYGSNIQYEGHVAGSEFWREFNYYSQNMVQIVPKYNMINNVGFSKDSEHFDDLKLLPKKIRQLFNMKTYEYDFPLIHPKYVIPDDNYMKKVDAILGYNKPFVQIKRYFECCIYKIHYYGLFKSIAKAIKNRKK